MNGAAEAVPKIKTELADENIHIENEREKTGQDTTLEKSRNTSADGQTSTK